MEFFILLIGIGVLYSIPYLIAALFRRVLKSKIKMSSVAMQILLIQCISILMVCFNLQGASGAIAYAPLAIISLIIDGLFPSLVAVPFILMYFIKPQKWKGALLICAFVIVLLAWFYS